MKNVLIADEHYIVRIGMRWIFEQHFPDFNVCFAEDGDAVYEQVRSTVFDLVILDPDMPQSDGLALVQLLLRRNAALRIVVHSAAPEQAYALRYFKAGVRGFLPKNSNPDRVKEIIQTVLAGRRCFTREILDEISSAYFQTEIANPFTKLSNREFEIATQLIKGRGLPEISQHLKLQKTTVSTYKKRLLEKLNARNVLDVRLMARQYNFE